MQKGLYVPRPKSAPKNPGVKATIAVAVSAIIRLLPNEKAAQRAAEKRRRKLAKKYRRNAPQVIAEFNAQLSEEWDKFKQIEQLCYSLLAQENNSFHADLALYSCLRLPLSALQQLSEDCQALSDDECRVYVQLYLDHATKGHNHCPHQPAHLDFDRFVNPYDVNAQTDFQRKNRRPRVLYEAMERVLYACLNPEAFRHLFFSKTHYRVKRWQKCERQFRSEAREAMGKLLTMMIMHMDIYSGTVGFHKDKALHGFSYAQFAALTGMSKSRVRRAMRKLSKLGWLGSVARCIQLPNGLRLNVAPLRSINLALFKSLGMEAFITQCRSSTRQSRRRSHQSSL